MFPIEQDTEFVVTEIPHSREAEEAVIGAVLCNPDIYSEVGLEPGQFYIHRLGYIWTAAKRVRERGAAIDILTICEELDDMGRMDEIGGAPYITSLMNQCPNTLNAGYKRRKI
jgi:replicative DNA helicase